MVLRCSRSRGLHICRLRACRRRPPRPSARAALRVTPAMHSSTVRRNWVAARFRAERYRGQWRGSGVGVGRKSNGHGVASQQIDRWKSLLAQEVEGSRKEERQRCRRRTWRRCCARRCARDGRRSARDVSRGELRAAAGWRADPHAASRAGSAHSAAANTRETCSGVNAMPSQNASTASTRCLFGQSRQHLGDDGFNVRVFVAGLGRQQRVRPGTWCER